MPTEAPPAAPSHAPSAESALPGQSEGLTKMADAFTRMTGQVVTAPPEGEWVQVQPKSDTVPVPQVLTHQPAPPRPAPQQPPPPQEIKSEPPPRPASQFDFSKPATEQPRPPQPAPSDGDIPAEITSPAQRDNWRALATARDIEAKRAEEAETKLKALQKELDLSKGKAVDSEQIELVRKENEELSKRIQLLDVTQHPKFQAYFAGKERAIADQIKAAAGPELGAKVVGLLAAPDTQERANMLAEAISELPMWNQTKINNYAIQLDQLHTEREQAIADAGKAREALLLEREQTENARKQETERNFNRVMAMAQDPKQGLEVLVPKDGDESHNATVRAAIEQARSIFLQKLDPEDMARAAMWAAAAPIYREAVFRQGALIRQYEEQLKAIQGTQPGLAGKHVALEEPNKANADEPFISKFKGALGWQ